MAVVTVVRSPLAATGLKWNSGVLKHLEHQITAYGLKNTHPSLLRDGMATIVSFGSAQKKTVIGSL